MRHDEHGSAFPGKTADHCLKAICSPISLKRTIALRPVAFGENEVIALVPATVGGVGGVTRLSPYLGYVGLLIMIAGMVVRWWAIAALNRQFTIDVNIVEGHKLVQEGLYRIVRHPAYLGGQLTMIGLGMALENWLSLLILFIVPLTGHLYRISKSRKRS